MILPALIAKFLSAGAIAQAATGATVAVVAFTGVGAVGALPDPVQDTFATVVAEITPLEPPTSEEPTEELTEEPTEELVSEETDVEDVEPTIEAPEVPADAEALAAQVKDWALTGPAEGESISDWASKGSTTDMKGWLRAHGMTFGNVVSAHASGKGFSEEERATLGADEQPVDAPTEPVSDEVSEEESDEVSETDDTEVVATTEDSGSHGNGKGNGNGGGNGRGNAKN